MTSRSDAASGRRLRPRIGAASGWRRGWWSDRGAVFVAIAVAYGPIVASSPGQVGADTKSYLYLDPSGLLGQALSLWDADRALGTVTHQTIGYLWPMGPFYWLLDSVGCPDWLAQRLWLGTLLAAAGLGVRYLLRTLGFQGQGLLVAVLAYQLSPYLLQYSARISAVLLPWAGLGWMIGLTARAARTGGWRHPALFALTVLTVGSVNATSLALAGLGPLLWLAHAALVERSITPGRAAAAAVRIGVLSAGVSLWWVAALLIQGAYSLPVTHYTETYEVVADASTAPEILRGLGYWFFYGNDKFGQWIEPSVAYTQGLWLVFLSFGLVVGAIGLAAAVRWRHLSYFLLLLSVGALIGVGAHPYDSPSPAGGLFKAVTGTDAGLALRSTPRAGPLVALSVAVLAGAGINALRGRVPAFGALVGLGVLAAVVLANPAVWRLRMVEERLQRPEDLPEYWLEAAEGLAPSIRMWEIPGSDFASYRWGNTVDPVTPGLVDGGYVARELVPFGSAASASLLAAVDRRLQEGTLEAAALAPVARLMGVDRIVHRADLAFERFRTPRPVETAELLGRAPGLTPVAAYGEAAPNVAGPEQTMIDEIHLARAAAPDHPSPVTVYEVRPAGQEVYAKPAAGATVLVGDADGIIDGAAAGVLAFTDASPMFFASDLMADPELLDAVMGTPAEIVVTDSNRRRAQRWVTLRETRGYTEMAGQEPIVHDPTDNRLPVFSLAPELADDVRTVSEQRGPVSVQASAYGNPVTYTNDDRPFHAVDGSVDTAWAVAAFDEPRGEFLRLTLAEPALIPAVRLVQPLGAANRRVTEVEVRADGRPVVTAALDARSLTPSGQTVPLGVTASVLEVEITDTDVPRQAIYPGVDPVGFAEVDLGLGPVTEVIRTPRALADRLGDGLGGHSVTVVLTRERSDPREPVRVDPEPRMVRAVPLPADRQAALTGTARLSAHAPSTLIDQLLGFGDGAGDSPAMAASSGRLPGDLPSRASAVLDGDPATAWTGLFGPQAGQWIEIRLRAPLRTDRIELDVVTDSLHSVPTALRALVDGVDMGSFATGLALRDEPLDTVATVTLPIDASGSVLRLVAEDVDERRTRDWHSNTLQPLPISIAEVRFVDTAAAEGALSGWASPLDTAEGALSGWASPLDTGCRGDLVSVNGVPVPVRVTGSAVDAEARRRLRLEGCEPVILTGGETMVVTAAGASTGIDIDQIVLSSPVEAPVPIPGLGPVHSSGRQSDTRSRVGLDGSPHDRWLVLGQSYNRGWQATADGADLGEPVLIDGYANGWHLPAGGAVRVDFQWRPQRWVDRALALSGVLVLLTVVAAVRGRADRGRPPPGLGRADLGPARPRLALPWLEPAAGSAPLRAAAAAAATVTVVAAAFLPEPPRWLWVAPILGGAVFVTARWPRTEPMLLLAAASSLAGAAAWIMVEQRRFRHPPDFGWPQQFEEVHILGVITILLALAAYARTVASTRDGPRSPR